MTDFIRDNFNIDIFYNDTDNHPNCGSQSIELSKEQAYLLRDSLTELIDMVQCESINEPESLQVVKYLRDYLGDAIWADYEY